jgi:hypothetical protein
MAMTLTKNDISERLKRNYKNWHGENKNDFESPSTIMHAVADNFGCSITFETATRIYNDFKNETPL